MKQTRKITRTFIDKVLAISPAIKLEFEKFLKENQYTNLHFAPNVGTYQVWHKGQFKYHLGIDIFVEFLESRGYAYQQQPKAKGGKILYDISFLHINEDGNSLARTKAVTQANVEDLDNPSVGLRRLILRTLIRFRQDVRLGRITVEGYNPDDDPEENTEVEVKETKEEVKTAEE